MKKKLVILSGIVLGLAPVLVFAASTGGFNSCATSTTITDLTGILCKIGQLLNIVVPLLIALGVIYFIWGVISYVIGTDEETKKSAREKMIYGIIGLAVIVGIWGLVKILTTTFGVNTGQQDITLPTTPY